VTLVLVLVLIPVLVLVVIVLAPLMSVHDACRARLRHNVATPLPGGVGCRA